MKTIKKQNKENINIQLTFGSDPEAFLFDTESGKIVSAIEILKRDKYDPINLGNEVSTYFDNAMIEFTIKPATSKESLTESFRDAFDKINLMLHKEYGEKYKLINQASHEFDSDQLDNDEAKKIGCNPEFNADENSIITPPDFNGNLRSAGGHLSVGRVDFNEVLGSKSRVKIDKDNDLLLGYDSKIDMIKLLDYFVGVPFTLIDNDKTSLSRRQIYGSPSSYRPKDFGIEYRVLSCLWTSSPKLVSLVYDLCYHAVQKLIDNDQQEVFETVDKKMVNAAIKENNKELAHEIIDELKLPKSIMVQLNQLQNVKNWNLYKEWKLENYSKSEVIG